MNEPLFISFATKDTGYVDDLQNLLRSLREFQLDYHYELIPSLGSWQANNAGRPTWIRHCLERFQRPVVWLDADAIVRQRPHDFWLEGFDFMAYRRTNGRLSAGTMYWAPTRTGLALLREWERRAAIPFEQWPKEYQRITEWHLRDAFESTPGVRYNPLDETYLTIFDRPPAGAPVVEHFQASRRLIGQVGDQRSQ